MTNTRKTTKVNYTFDHGNKIIWISKGFSKAAEIIGSDAYKQLVVLIKDFPTYTILVKEPKKKEGKVSYKGLTLNEMRRFVGTIGNEESALFERVIAIAQNKTAPYAVIKKWFLKNYKEAYLNEIANVQDEILDAELDELNNEVDVVEFSNVVEDVA